MNKLRLRFLNATRLNWRLLRSTNLIITFQSLILSRRFSFVLRFKSLIILLHNIRVEIVLIDSFLNGFLEQLVIVRISHDQNLLIFLSSNSFAEHFWFWLRFEVHHLKEILVRAFEIFIIWCWRFRENFIKFETRVDWEWIDRVVLFLSHIFLRINISIILSLFGVLRWALLTLAYLRH